MRVAKMQVNTSIGCLGCNTTSTWQQTSRRCCPRPEGSPGHVIPHATSAGRSGFWLFQTTLSGSPDLSPHGVAREKGNHCWSSILEHRKTHKGRKGHTHTLIHQSWL
ncbi:uncharacterized protein LOC129809159 [Phlebotomus papatasi]|uniref:uncharacterized protein LOC129809158 n=1 Tax=Phlebotomus papatasi TaxID=29031 RepID=UPI00248347C8|nr:uncharacterized protein LOC129809158 [Phlebotomus papatasi]XP_055714944.1 uncharacterized protein LOC129809159 [Phlebotomus papatasi]